MKKIAVMVVGLCLVGCGANQYDNSGETHYLTSRNGVDLVVPPPLTASNISHFYDLPPQNQNPKVSVEPPA